MSRILASILDANIYDRDFILFQKGNWLNDSCINYCFRRLEQQISNKSILLLDPSIVSFLIIQCTEDDEYSELSLGVEIALRVWILVPVSNSNTFDTPSSHWSLLLLHVPTGSVFHLDSCRNSNHEAAISTSANMFLLLQRTDTPKITTVADCPQQNNGYDCGVYLLLFAEHLISMLSTLTAPLTTVVEENFSFLFDTMRVSVTGTDADSFRRKIYSEISLVSET